MTSATVAVGSSGHRCRIWFVSELFWPEETSTGYFVTRIAEDAAAEHEVHAVASQPTYAARGTVAPRVESRNGVRIERLWSTHLNKDVLRFRVLNLLTFSCAVFLHLLARLRRGDVVVAVTNPPLVPYAARAAAATRNARFVLLIHDVYPEVLVAAGAARARALHVRLLDAASRWLYRSAERVVVLGRDMEALVRGKLALPSRAPVVIPNWGDVEQVRPDPTAGALIRARLGLRDRFIVQTMGNMGRTHDLRSLLDAATALAGDERCHFLFVGWGAQRAWLEREARARALTNVTVHDACGRAELSAFLNAADVHVIAFRRGMAGVSVPSRLYNIMAAGKPVLVLADPASELAQVVSEARIGWVNEPGDAQATVHLLRRLAAHPDLLAQPGARARDVAVRQYSRRCSAAAWLRLFREMTTTKGRVPA